jgi:hypothetical protein
MAKRDPLTFSKPRASFGTMVSALKESAKNPYIGVTQGGSSRKFSGAKPAATDGQRRTQRGK